MFVYIVYIYITFILGILNLVFVLIYYLVFYDTIQYC